MTTAQNDTSQITASADSNEALAYAALLFRLATITARDTTGRVFAAAKEAIDAFRNEGFGCFNARQRDPQPDVIDESVVGRIVSFIRRFVFLKSPSLYTLLALWAVQTYLYREFEYCGLILACSPEPGCGKTRLLEVLRALSANAEAILVNPTEATLFRTIEGHTNFLDEVDTWQNREALQPILNAAVQRGGTVRRMERAGEKFEPVQYPVFAPIALAGIGTRILPGSTKDRTFAIHLVRQMREERRERFRERTLRAEVSALCKDVAAWVQEKRAAILKRYETEPAYLAQFRDRTIDIAEPLAAILEVACPNRRADLLEAISITRDESAKPGREHRILERLTELAEKCDPLVGNASELAEMLDLEQAAQALEVGATLHKYGFETKGVRAGDSVRYRYTLSAADLRECCQRFVVGSVDSGGANAA